MVPATGLDYTIVAHQFLNWCAATVHRTVAFSLFESDYQQKEKRETERSLFFLGAGNRTRTGTLLRARDFKSLVSTDFTMPAWLLTNDSTLFPFRQVMEQKNRITAGQCSMQRQVNNAPGTNPVPDDPFLSWNPRSAVQRYRILYYPPSALPDT